MKRQILVPLDGSLLAETVLPHAVNMARLMGSELLLLRSVPEPRVVEPLVATGAPSISGWELWDQESAEATRYMDEVAGRLRDKGLVAETRISDNPPADDILGCAEEPGVTMIAMATHGRSGLKRWVFGSVAEQVIHSTNKPVLLVHPADSEHITEAPQIPDTPAVYRKILLPLDGSTFAEQAIGWAQALATASGAGLVLTTVVVHKQNGQPAHNSHVDEEHPATPSGEGRDLDRMSQYLAATAEKMRTAGFIVEGCVTEGSPVEGIMRVGEQAHADIVVMATHGRSGLQRVWLGSVAQSIVRAANLPILLIKVRAQEALAAR